MESFKVFLHILVILFGVALIILGTNELNYIIGITCIVISIKNLFTKEDDGF